MEDKERTAHVKYVARRAARAMGCAAPDMERAFLAFDERVPLDFTMLCRAKPVDFVHDMNVVLGKLHDAPRFAS